MLLLKDGVKYLPYEYASEEELAQMVIEHYKEIFGANTLYFDPQTMKTHIGIKARNDGIIFATDQKHHQQNNTIKQVFNILPFLKNEDRQTIR